jgi:hypothetical protein
MIFLKNSYYEILYGFRKRIFLTFYTLSFIFTMILLLLAINSEFSIAPKIQLLIGFLMTIAAVIGGGILSVYFDLPAISAEFDEIKNDIAKKIIKSPEEFGYRLTKLLCKFFNFQFFNIEYSFIKIIGAQYVYSNPELIKLGNLNLENISNDLINKSKNTEEVFFYDKFKVNSQNNYLYILPIWFGDDWLGFIGILSHRKVNKLFLRFLNNFENEYIDDQIVHVLDYKKSQIQKRFYKKLDSISNRITRKMYSDLIEFEQDIIKVIIDEVNCIGGLFVTIYDSEIVILWKDNLEGNRDFIDNFRNYFSKHFVPSTPRIMKDNNIEFKYIFEIPIFLDKLQGIILLFDNDDQNFRYFENTLLEIENIKLDNDLENLAIMLNLQPNENSPIISTHH